MPEKPRSYNHNPGTDSEFSLSDLLPDLLDTPPASKAASAPAPAKPAASPSPFPDLPANPELAASLLAEASEEQEEQEGTGNIRWVVLAVVGGILVPAILVGLFILVVNNFFTLNQPDQIVQEARTPVPTVYSVTPLPTPRPTSSCARPATVGPFDGFNCAREIPASGDFTTFFSLADLQLNQDGQRAVGPEKHFQAVSANPTEILQFYASSLKAKGYTLSRGETSGATQLGAYRAVTYAKGNQQAQILVISLNRADAGGNVKAGESLIRLSFS
jgi:hypothetical protein